MDERVFFDQKSQNLVDSVHEVNGVLRGFYSHQTLEEMKVRYPEIVVMDTMEAVKLHESKFITPVTEIDDDRFSDMLEVLPPSRWKHFPGGEHFHICERISGNIVSWCVRIGSRYFTFQDVSNLSTDDIAKSCVAFIDAQKVETKETLPA